MSVVGSDFEKLKRFNLAEIYDPTPKPEGPKQPAVIQTAAAAKSASGPLNPALADLAAL